MINNILNKFGYYKKTNKNAYQEICYAELGNPEKNSDRLLRFVADGNEWIQKKNKEDYQFVGIFFTIVLLIEYKLSQLLIGFDPDIENKMLGQKVDVYKDFLKAYEPDDDEDIDVYRHLIGPLKDLKKIRNKMAHDISKSKFSYDDIKHIASYVKKKRPDLFNGFKDCKDEDTKSIATITTFGFVFAVEIAKLRMSIV